MDKNRIIIAMKEAERFIAAGKQALGRLALEEGKGIYQMKEVAACRRASLDLTRTLAELRKS